MPPEERARERERLEHPRNQQPGEREAIRERLKNTGPEERQKFRENLRQRQNPPAGERPPSGACGWAPASRARDVKR